MTQVSLSTSTNYSGEQNALIEDQQTALTVNFELDEPAPSGGLKVFVDSNVPQIVNRLDLPGFAFNPTVENINPALFGTSFDNSGFFLTIDEGATSASFTINVFDNPEPDTFLPETFDGLVEAEFSLVAPDGVEQEDLGDVGNLGNYTINPDAASSTVIFADEESQLTDIPEPPTTPEPPPSILPIVSLHTGPNFLVESEGTVSAHVFNITEGTIPEEGLVVAVSAPNLGEFDLNEIEVIDGEIVAVREDGFDIRLTDFTTLVNLPIAEDNLAEEGINTANFTLEVGNGYEVHPELNGGEFSLFYSIEDTPPNLGELNDTIALASQTGISPENSQVTISGSLDFEIGNRYQNEDGSFTYIDGTEDVDFYQVDLRAGDIIAFDIDAVIKGNPSITEFVRDRTQGNPILRLFDAQGNELGVRGLGQGPGELFATSTDPYLEFQAPADGSYYLGVSVFTNGIPYRFGGGQFGDTQGYIERTYDPLIPGSGDGDSRGGLDYRGIGEYDLQITLNPENPVLIAPQQDRSNNTPPEVIDVPAPGEPTVSLSFVAGTYDPDDNLIDGNLVEGLPNQGSILTLVMETEGEIPEEGILVTINSNGYLRDYFTVRTLVSPPFSPGAELVDVVSDDTGRETGIQLRIFEPITFFPLNARTQLRGELLELETDGPEEVTFFLEGGEGYGVSATNNQITGTFYDSVEQAGEPSVIPEVSVTISETKLIESEGTPATLNFSLSEPPPEDGVLVYVKSDTEFVLSQFDIFNVEVSGGTFPFFNGDFSGFYFKITEQEAEIDLSAFPDPFTEGLQDYQFTIQEAAGYTINPDAGEINFSIADNPDSVVEVSLSREPEVLVESDGTSSIHTFELSAAPPESGITLEIDAPNLNEFDLSAVSVTGGEIADVTDTSFSFNISETTATIDLPVLADGEIENLETATFTLLESGEYLVNPEANQATFTLVDTPDLIPSPTEEGDTNDTIPQATVLNLNPKNSTATVNGDLAPREPNSERTDYRDFSEDVDFYSFEVTSTVNEIIIDIDTIEYDIPRYEGIPQRLDSELRLFDAQGNELARVNSGAAPDEELSRDPYLRYTLENPGTYYIGISQLGNRDYDPFTARSGSGWLFPQVGVYAGEYQLNVELISGEVELSPESEPIFGSIEGDIIEVSGKNQLVFAGSSDDLIDASIASEGGNRLYGSGGDDTFILGTGDGTGVPAVGDRIFGGDGADKFYNTSGGNNLITGGAGADQFWIAVAEIPEDSNTITDFTIGEDVLGIAGLGIGFEDLTITQMEDKTLVAANGADLAILQGIDATSLTANDFAFA